MQNLKNTTSEYNKKERLTDLERTNQWLPVDRGEREGRRGKIGVGEQEARTVYKINKL